MSPPERVRLAELLAGLSIATDLGLGFPPEKTVRNAFISARLAAELGLADRACGDVYFASLLRYIGCTSFALDVAQHFGNEMTVVHSLGAVDETRPREVLPALVQTVRAAGRGQRTRVLANNVVKGRAFGAYLTAADCEARTRLAQRFTVGDRVTGALRHVTERWDGNGGPYRLSGEAIDLGARIFALADQVEIVHRTHGPGAAIAMARRRAGGWFDPECVQAFLRCADDVFGVIDSGAAWSAGLAAEPEPHVFIPSWGVDDVAVVFADFADLKSPYLFGHSSGVARLAVAAAERLGLPETDRTVLRRAALLHDLGRVAVSSAIWNKPAPLSPPEWEQVRLHPYYTERVLTTSPLLEPLAVIAGAHHERPDGRGYHRGIAAVPPLARILAAADVFQARTESRPYRPALAPDAAAAEVESLARAGALDPQAAEAVCATAGVAIRAAPVRPAGLTEREIDVLRLLARGRSKKEIARELKIAPGTVHTHVTHLYQKTGVSTRAGIAVFALEHGLA
jgi:HD-GYP domain-containing protein (c-di-GMP phosphodiesterase class II)/DNA-binding CsgD family transcriptional regulator